MRMWRWGEECGGEAAALVSGGFTHAPPQLFVRTRRTHSDGLWWIGCEWDSEGQKKKPYLILHFIFFLSLRLSWTLFSVSCIGICGRHLAQDTRPLGFFPFFLKWQHSLKCDEKTLNLAQKLRHRRTAGRRGCPNTQVELRSRSFGSLNYSKHAKLKKEDLRLLVSDVFFSVKLFRLTPVR